MRWMVGAAGLVVALACSSSSAPMAKGGASLDDQFSGAATESGVPRDLLVAVARVEGGLTMPRTREVDVASQVPVAGPLELRRGKLDTLARGAALVGASEIELRRDSDLALRAGALVVAELGRSTGARSDDLASWEGALEELSGYADAHHRADYAKRVFAALEAGGAFEARGGESISLAPHIEVHRAATVEITQPEHTLGTLPEYPGAQVFITSCTNKCDTTRGGASIDYVVIHDTEGGWDASVATLQNDSGKSVQYIVDTDGTVGQFVPESYTAWHDGNYYYNQRSVGIEHVGYFNKTYPDAEYDASAKLVGYLTKKYGIAKDRSHIFGHDQVPNGNVMAESSPVCELAPADCESGTNYGGAANHRDPGDWEWCTYMPRFGGTCKCNDIWNLWNCSSDKTQAFRCVSGNVELVQCTAGCTVEALGVDDQCDQLPPSDAGTTPPANDAGPTSPIKNRPPGSNVEQDGGRGGGGGCAVASGPRDTSASAFAFAFALALALAFKRKS